LTWSALHSMTSDWPKIVRQERTKWKLFLTGWQSFDRRSSLYCKHAKIPTSIASKFELKNSCKRCRLRSTDHFRNLSEFVGFFNNLPVWSVHLQLWRLGTRLFIYLPGEKWFGRYSVMWDLFARCKGLSVVDQPFQISQNLKKNQFRIETSSRWMCKGTVIPYHAHLNSQTCHIVIEEKVVLRSRWTRVSVYLRNLIFFVASQPRSVAYLSSICEQFDHLPSKQAYIEWWTVWFLRHMNDATVETLQQHTSSLSKPLRAI
jgi:hypothetical protein